MISTALKPKWLALLGLVLGICVLFGWLGLWQLNVAQRKGQTEALAEIQRAPEVPVDQILPPQTALQGEHVGRSVRATGRYDGARQLLVVDRRLGDRQGVWVLTPLVVEGTGARLAVVRGFLAAGSPAPAPPTGTVTVHGTLEPQQGPPEKPRPLPSGQVGSVDLASAVNVWPGDVYNGFVLAASEDPASADALTPVPPPKTDVGDINWRNAAYAVQWWIFAAFALYMWWRLVRDDHELGTADPDGLETDPHDPADGAGSPLTPGGHTR